MNGYQPKKTCDNCIAFYVCQRSKKAEEGKEACKKYKTIPPPPPPKSGSNAQTPTYTPPPMPEVKPPKQRTVLSVRDFAILYNMVNYQVMKMENATQDVWRWRYNKERTEEDIEKEKQENMERLRQNLEYQDLLRIRDKLGELNIEVETPVVEVE